MHSFRTEGIIIKRKNYGEADRILTVFTRHQGKVKVLAKGVRKISSRRAPHVELLNLSILNLHQGKMLILTEAETLNHFSSLKDDLGRSGYAFYVCELIDGLLPEHQQNREAFSLLETEKDCRLLIQKFEQELLGLLGFWPKDRLYLEDSDAFIENIMERKIKTKRILPNIF